MEDHPALDLIEANNQWYSAKAGLGHKPSRRVAVVTCMDCRMDPHRFLGLEPGSAHILRNAGGRAADALRSLIISQQCLGTDTAVVIHHTECGAKGLNNNAFQDVVKCAVGVDSCDMDFQPFEDLEQSVLDDMALIKESPFVWTTEVQVFGYIYDVKTGTIHRVEERGALNTDEEILRLFEEGNKRYRAAFVKGDMHHKPSQKLAVITCMDCRLDHMRILGLELGDAHIITNAGGRIDDALRSLVISQHALGTTGVAVIHHTECGANKLDNNIFRVQLKKKFSETCTIDFLPFKDLERSVIDDVEAIERCPYVPKFVAVRGYVYDVATGSLRRLDCGRKLGIKHEKAIPTPMPPPVVKVQAKTAALPAPVATKTSISSSLPDGDMQQSSVVPQLTKANGNYASSFALGTLSHKPSRKVAVVTCMDCRLEPARSLGLEPGEAHIIRNAGGRAADALRSLVVSQQCLGTTTVIVIHHTKCGMAFLNVDNLKAKLKTELGVAKVDMDFQEFGDLEQSVLEDMHIIKSHPLIADYIEVYGFVYDVETGTIQEVKDEVAPLR
ncbi:hypothetical protein CBR_g10864 [Chara braunii]|uniref:Carbonic anhydrase n=1 Tax=Chara braunii TaxID=69332 RepID=A0A388KPJ7_CHABU|nr:hypothetical protein CBR_g10864 [Chara braunii]|eukprot:GBG71928.1 hypothetical protein CBR_g10864 [Chara braunii]